MGCACTKSAKNESRDVVQSEDGQKTATKAYSRPQVRHFDGSTKVGNEPIEVLHKVNSRTRQSSRQDSMDKRKQQQNHHLHHRPRNISKHIEGEQVAAGWPGWLSAVAGEAIKGWIPRRADAFEKLDKIGQGTYSNVYKARDLDTGKIVALKKVRFDSLEPESVKFMAREIQILRRLDHPNVIKLEGLVTSRMSSSLYLVFEYMEHDLAGLAACPSIMFTEPQVKCYMQQLLRGLDHCHTKGVLHRDIKGSNLLIDNNGILKIADFGLATFYNPDQKMALTSRVVTLWYRPPELLLGAQEYGVGVDLWSTGCILAELLAGRPIMPGRTEVEQLHKIFKLCGSPSDDYWKKTKLPHATMFKPQQPYKRCIAETFKDFPPSALSLLETLLAIEPADRGVASTALKSEFFTTKPLPCDPSSLPRYPPSKELDAKMRDEEARRQRNKHGVVDGRRHGSRERPSRAVPAPDANAELQATLQKRRLHSQSSKSKSEKFSYMSEKTATGFPIEPPLPRQSHQAQPSDITVSRQFVPPTSSRSGPIAGGPIWSKKHREDDVRMAPPRPPSKTGRPPHAGAKAYSEADPAAYSKADSSRKDAGDSSKHNNNLRNALKAADRKHDLDSRRSDVFRGVPSEAASRAIDAPPIMAFDSQSERMYHSGPLLRPGLSTAVDIEELYEEHERKLKEAVRRAGHDLTQNPTDKNEAT